MNTWYQRFESDGEQMVREALTFFFWIREFDSRKLGVRDLLLHHRDVGWQSKIFKGPPDEAITDTVQRCIDKSNSRRSVEWSVPIKRLTNRIYILGAAC
jgi:hypothetical protein